MSSRRLARAAIICVCAAGANAMAQEQSCEQQKLLPDEADVGDKFGRAVDIDGERGVIGAFQQGETARCARSAYVFSEVASVWIQEVELRPAPADPGDWAGDAIETLPAHRGGQDLVGTRFPKLAFEQSIIAAEDAEDPRCGEERPPAVTMYRWWTDRCPYCEASLPAIEGLRKRYGPRGLRVIAVYHAKPPREVTDEFVVAAARERGYHGELAVDERWSALREVYLDKRKRGATSVTFIVDREGIIRFVHPGPVFHPSDDPRLARENADYRLVEQAVRVLIERDEAARREN